MGLNRISWKPGIVTPARCINTLTLPMGLNRISWKPLANINEKKRKFPLPMGLNRINWKRVWMNLY